METWVIQKNIIETYEVNEDVMKEFKYSGYERSKAGIIEFLYDEGYLDNPINCEVMDVCLIDNFDYWLYD